ncbi:hypothetical protein R6Q59_004524 [Mikania micrantha]
MNSNNFSSDRCNRIVDILYDLFDSGKDLSTSISFEDIRQLQLSCDTERRAETSDAFDKPMVWIGIYIAIASLFCIFAMAADLWHGFRHKKFWFPCKYFTLNAASITVIAVTMKLPVDLTSGSADFVDQGAKLGSLGFMCTMMANLMPSLASMDNKTLLANVIDSKERESTDGELAENLPHTLIAANLMYRITQTILVRYQNNIQLPITKKQLFAHLSGMIADIFCACFTNIPRVITMRCQESVIEKREASVKVAAMLLGKTRKIIETLEARDIPNMDDEKKAYIDEWRLYLKQSIP